MTDTLTSLERRHALWSIRAAFAYARADRLFRASFGARRALRRDARHAINDYGRAEAGLTAARARLNAAREGGDL